MNILSSALEMSAALSMKSDTNKLFFLHIYSLSFSFPFIRMWFFSSQWRNNISKMMVIFFPSSFEKGIDSGSESKSIEFWSYISHINATGTWEMYEKLISINWTKHTISTHTQICAPNKFFFFNIKLCWTFWYVMRIK